MRALVTRPKEDAERLARLLADRGVEAVIEPLIEVRPLPGARVDLEGAQAILLTSANGARVLASLVGERGVPVYAVGETTAAAAREAGFRRVETAGGDVAALAALVRARLEPVRGALVHVAGSKVAGDLGGELARAGFGYRRAVVYEARTAERFSPEAAAALKDGSLDVALFFSPRTAATFVNLARQAGVAACCQRIAALCLSQAVAESAGSIAWRALRVAARPDRNCLLALVDAERRRASERVGP